MNRPEKSEYNPYFQKYIDLVPRAGIMDILRDNAIQTHEFFKSIPEEKHEYMYAPGKWTCKEILMHLIDTERVMQYRALVAMRGDADTPLPPVDENLFARNVEVSNRKMDGLLEEFDLVRRSTLMLFEHMTPGQSRLLGNGVSHPISARALGYIIPGHVMHHIGVIRERYLNSPFRALPDQ